MSIDHKDLLKKYIRYVLDCEGCDFIEDGYRGYPGDQQFTPEEWEELQLIAKPEGSPTTGF